MKRIVLIVLWLFASLAAPAAATAHSAVPPCHTDMAAPHGKKHLPLPADTGTMPCCSQPVVANDLEEVAIAIPPSETAQLFAVPVTRMIGLTTAAEPRPPKAS